MRKACAPAQALGILTVPSLHHLPADRASSGQRLSITSACHLGVLALFAGYLAVYYPGGSVTIIALTLAACISELGPSSWKQWLFGEIVLVVAGVASYVFVVDVNADSFQAWIRLLLVYWLLIPSRPGLLRWGLSLVVAELLILGAEPHRYHDIPLGRWPGLGRLRLPTPLLWLLPIGLISLALDAWLRGLGGTRTHQPHAHQRVAAYRWAVLPTLIIALALLVVGPMSLPLSRQIQPRLNSGPAQAGVKRPIIRPGESQWVVKDPTPKARLLWDDAEQPQVQGMAYLRVFTLPHIAIEDNLIAWGADDLNRLRSVDTHFDPNQRFAWVVRRPLGNDAVICGDGAIGIELPDLVGDKHGNRYQSNIDESPRAYRVNLDPAPEQDAEVLPEWTELPSKLDLLPWNRIEDPAWKDLSAAAAGEAIRQFLERHCRYDLENLPLPASGEGGVMRTFLFGSDTERRGHCQYFTTAAALMLRRLGHPTRCVAGFASDEHDAEGYQFRGLNAHAWLEVRDDSGRWLRIDPTPAQNLRGTGVDYHDPAHLPVLPGKKEIDTYGIDPAELAPMSAHRWWGFLVIVVLVFVGLFFKRRTTSPKDAHLVALDRQSGNLIRLASQLGVAVAPHTTLSDIARQLSERTGIDLNQALAAHLAARFNNGPLPPPWPIAELRQAHAQRAPSAR